MIDRCLLVACAGNASELEEPSVLLPPQLSGVHGLKRGAMMIAKHLAPVMWWLHSLLLGFELRAKLSPPNWWLPPLK